MVIALAARPNPLHHFDGKVGIWRVADIGKAKNNSKNRKKGDTVWNDINVDAARFRQFWKEDICPAAANAMPWVEEIQILMDRASPHVGKGNHGTKAPGDPTVRCLLNEIGAKFKPRIKAELQSPGSPEFNIFDLCLFPSMNVKTHKLQRQAKTGNKCDLWTNVRAVWADHEATKLERVWQNRELALRQAIATKGGNEWNIPHVKPIVRTKLSRKHRLLKRGLVTATITIFLSSKAPDDAIRLRRHAVDITWATDVENLGLEPNLPPVFQS